MRAITIKCPECGAVVNARPTDTTARCEYCGVTSQIRGRSRVLQIPRPPPAVVAGAPRMPVATAKPNPIGCIVVLAVIAAVAVPIVLLATKKVGVPDAVKKLERPQWDGASRPLITDLNGDGVGDFIGRARVIRPTDTMHLAAYDGTSGKRLWLSQALGPRGDWIHTPLGLTGGTVVISDGKAGLMGVSAADGSTRWTIRVNEAVKKICAGADDGTLALFTADEKTHSLTVADGAVVPASFAECKPVPTDDSRVDTPEVIAWNWHNPYRELVVENGVDGMYSHESLYFVPGDVAVAIGYKKPGSRVPMVAAYRWPDDALAAQVARVAELQSAMERAKGGPARGEAANAYMRARKELRELEQNRRPEVRWTAVVPGIDPLAAELREPDPEHVGVNADYVAVVYGVKGKAHDFRLTAFRMSDGTRAWDIELPGTSPMSAVGVSATHVMVSRWDGLGVYDLATGARAYTIE